MKGMIMPFPSGRDGCRVVTGVRARLGKVFSTKTRTPYMVALETVSLEEVREKMILKNGEE
jgi:hypothetical protein